MIRRLILSTLTVLFGLGCFSAAAHADSITFTLSSPHQYVSSTGGTLSFTATVAAPASNSGDLFLNSDPSSVTSPAGAPTITIDDNGFLANFFLPTFSPGTSVTGLLFALNVPGGLPHGDYTGFFDLYGGADGNANNYLGTVNFTATVTPEPSSLMLLGTGVAGAFAAFKRKGFSSL